MRAMTQYPIQQYYPKPGWVEGGRIRDLIYHFTGHDRGSGAECISASELVAIGITNQRETTILWEKATGKPIGRAIVWQCRRTAPICEQLRRDGLEPHIRQTTGLVLDPYFSATKIKWILSQEPNCAAGQNAVRFCLGPWTVG